MRIAIALLLLALQVPASALDFRGVQLGQSCYQAVEVELSLGTKPLYAIDLMTNHGFVVFEDQSIAGQRGRLTYKCTQALGTITRYSIEIETRSEARARAIYADAKAAALARLGAPEFDSDAPDLKERSRQAQLDGLMPFDAVANWNPAEHQHVSVALEKLSDDEEWRVSTMVWEELQEWPNESLERTRGR
jgi:hypothetical protein